MAFTNETEANMTLPSTVIETPSIHNLELVGLFLQQGLTTAPPPTLEQRQL